MIGMQQLQLRHHPSIPRQYAVPTWSASGFIMAEPGMCAADTDGCAVHRA